MSEKHDMENRSIHDLRLIESLECLRPGVADTSEGDLRVLSTARATQPEVGEAQRRLQGLDAAIGKAYRQVPVPEGLANRILARLSQTNTAPVLEPSGTLPPSPPLPLSPSPASQTVTESTNLPEVPRPPEPSWLRLIDQPLPDFTEVPRARAARPARPWRNRILSGVGVISLGTAFCLLLAVAWQARRPSFSKDDIQTAAMSRFGHDLTTDAPGQLVSAVTPPDRFPVSPDVAAGSTCRWRWVADFVGNQTAVAYDLTSARGVRATLYVLRRKSSDMPTAPSLRPAANTQGRSLGYWQSGDLLYVLVVNGDSQTYRSFFRPQSGPLAWRGVGIGAKGKV